LFLVRLVLVFQSGNVGSLFASMASLVGAGMPVGTAEKPFPLADERYNNRCIDNVAKIAAFLHISKRKKIY